MTLVFGMPRLQEAWIQPSLICTPLYFCDVVTDDLIVTESEIYAAKVTDISTAVDQEGTNLSSQHIDDKSEVDKSKLQLDDNDSVKDKKYTKKRKKGN